MVKGRGTYPQACVSILENSISRLPTLRCCGIRGTEIAFWFGSLIQRLSRPARRLFCCQVLGGRITPVDVTFGRMRFAGIWQSTHLHSAQKSAHESGAYQKNLGRVRLVLIHYRHVVFTFELSLTTWRWLAGHSVPALVVSGVTSLIFVGPCEAPTSASRSDSQSARCGRETVCRGLTGNLASKVSENL